MEITLKGLMFSSTIKDDRVEYGLFKKKIPYNKIIDMSFRFATEDGFGHIRLVLDEPGDTENSNAEVTIAYDNKQQQQASEARKYIFDHLTVSEEKKQQIEKRYRSTPIRYGSSTPNYPPSVKNKDKNGDASVVGRAVIGGIVAGPAGAVVGALSAIDKNNKKQK